ncbi:DUF1428 domain-containing protein [Ferrimonas marina]|uniref:Uncharacterized conserved protein YbaA, DUF1428 family n=1 Tax=Ferrimonas marina TaxID=299255 RepID=A0A1M5Z5M4_9GAMM|nr:DUF1428 domain-containing protein [Ferrimonas marina]SHI19575.1 Uncharacterized conserved protein YbaA, DUF1428 family [Ferrimonas marina]
MGYVDGFMLAVPTANKAAYLAVSQRAAEVFADCGATGYCECWGDEVPKGKVTDMHRAVQCGEDETVVFSWITWPSKAARDAGMAQAMKDPRLSESDMPFDGKRVIFGGFEPLFTL